MKASKLIADTNILNDYITKNYPDTGMRDIMTYQKLIEQNTVKSWEILFDNFPKITFDKENVRKVIQVSLLTHTHTHTHITDSKDSEDILKDMSVKYNIKINDYNKLKTIRDNYELVMAMYDVFLSHIKTKFREQKLKRILKI